MQPLLRRGLASLAARVQVDASVLEAEPQLVEMRRYLHRNPELGFQEHETGKFVVEKLRSYGIESIMPMGKTGILATLRGTGKSSGGARPLNIGLRADMDALPIQELNEFSHKSLKSGIAHLCGHDGHTTILLGTAQYLSRTRDTFSGKVSFIFQPAEEGLGGADAMIKDGCLDPTDGDKHGIDEIYGLHNWPGLELGVFGVKSGPLMAGANEFDLKITGKGCHAAMPHEGIDAITAASHLVVALQSIVSRQVNPVDSAVLTVSDFKSSNFNGAYNVVTGEVSLRGTLRSFNPAVMKSLKERLDRTAKGVCASFGTTYDLQISPIGYPPTINSVLESEHARRAAIATVGSKNVRWGNDVQVTMGAEDFAHFLERVPGCYVFLGSGEGATLHSPNYDFNDQLLKLGVMYFANIVRGRSNPSI